MIDNMISYSKANTPLQEKDLDAEEVANAALFLLSPMASAITGEVLYVDNGLHAMGMSVDSRSLQKTQSTKSGYTSTLKLQLYLLVSYPAPGQFLMISP